MAKFGWVDGRVILDEADELGWVIDGLVPLNSLFKLTCNG